MVIVKLNEQGQWVHKLEIPDAHPIQDGYVPFTDQPSVPNPERDFASAMDSARSAMAAILDALDMSDRMILQPLRVQIEHALNLGQVDLALYTIVNAEIPAELEPVRAQILALFPQS